MNFQYSPAGMDHSDAIVRKLNEIKNTIGGASPFRNSRSNAHVRSSAHNSSSHHHNLNDYLPDRVHTRLQQPNGEAPAEFRSHANRSESYRRSLEKKLERLFKEERAGWNQNISFMQEGPTHEQVRYEPEALQGRGRMRNPQSLTIDRMESKIQELQRKYLSDPQLSPLAKPKPARNKAKSMQLQKEQKYGKPNKRAKNIKKVPEKNQYEFQEQLLRELCDLRGEVNFLKRNNEDLAGKLEQKHEDRRSKKERGKFLLNCIIEKLDSIQKQVERKRQKQGRRHVEKSTQQADEDEKAVNEALMKEVQGLRDRLRKVNAEKEIAEERSQWIENELRKINKI